MAFNKHIATLLLVVVAASVATSTSVAIDEYDCPRICPALYAPICATIEGKFFKEFSNTCEMKVSNCRHARSAIEPYIQTDMFWCSSEPVENLHESLANVFAEKPECNKPCAMIWAPLCVSNGKIRGIAANKCVMDLYNCAVSNNNVAAQLFRVLRPDSC